MPKKFGQLLRKIGNDFEFIFQKKKKLTTRAVNIKALQNKIWTSIFDLLTCQKWMFLDKTD